MRVVAAARICRPVRLASDSQCAGCVVRASVEGAALPPVALEQVLQRTETFALPAKGTLYRQGEPAEALCVLRRGSVKLLRQRPGEVPVPVRLAKAGTAIGLETVLQGAYCRTALAIEAVEYCRVPAAVLRHLEASGRGFYRALMRQWQVNLDEAESLAGSLGAGTAEQRLARLLLKLGAMQDGRHCVSLLRSDIGSLLGVSMETASRLMAAFRRSGVIQGAGRRLQCDAARLRQIAGGA